MGVIVATAKRRKDVILRQIHGSYLLVDITDVYHDDSCSIFELNEIGAFIWSNIDGTRSLKSVAALLSDEIIESVPLELIEEDVEKFVEELFDMGFIEVA